MQWLRYQLSHNFFWTKEMFMHRMQSLIFLIFIFFVSTQTEHANGAEPAPIAPVSAQKAAMSPGSTDANNSQDITKVTLESALHIALTNNPELSATKWDVSAAQARVETALTARWPSLSVEGGYQHYLDDQRLIAARYNGETGKFDTENFRGDLVLKLPVYTGGRFTAEIEIAELLKTAEERRLVQTREELIFNVSSTFYTLLGQREVIHSLEFAVDAMESHRRQIQDLLAVQKAARVDLLRTEVQLANLKYTLVAEQNGMATQKLLLANLLGVDYDPEPIPANEQLEANITVSPDPVELLAVALKTRGDFLSARARLESQDKRVESARSGSRPTVSLFGSYGTRADSGGNDENIGSAGVLVTIPVFDGGQVDAKVATEQAILAASQDRLKKLELQIRREIETALLDIRSSRERIKAARQSLEQAGESLRIERLKYGLSSGSMLEVLDAQTALLQSETNHTRAQVDNRIAMARLKLATGENVQ